MSNLKGRYLASFTHNVIRGILALLTSSFLARSLGPGNYGTISFLLVTFTSLRSLLDLGTSPVFFTLISQRKRTKRFIFYYWGFIILQFALSTLILFVFLPKSYLYFIWGLKDSEWLFMAFIATFIQGTVWNLASYMAEANKQSLKLQRINTVLLLFYLLVLILLWKFSLLTISNIFGIIIIGWLIASILAFKLYNPRIGTLSSDIKEENIYSVLKEFRIIGWPLLILSFLTFVHDFTDRSLLQRWGGSIQQGYFSIAQQFSVVSLLATTSILRIFWKEVAESFQKSDFISMNLIFNKTARYIFLFSCLITGFLLQVIPEVIQLTLGNNYSSAYPIFFIMFLYPIYQSMGQLAASFLMATSDNKFYGKVLSLSLVMSLIVVYFILAPRNNFIPGYQLGAVGLSVKFFIMQFLTVNILLFYIARKYRWSFGLFFDIMLICIFIVLGFFVTFIYSNFLDDSNLNIYYQIVVKGILYILFVVLLFYSWPQLLFLSKTELKRKFLGLFNK